MGMLACLPLFLSSWQNLHVVETRQPRFHSRILPVLYRDPTPSGTLLCYKRIPLCVTTHNLVTDA